MRKILFIFSLFLASQLQGQTFSFQCVCEHLTAPNCDICNTNVLSRSFHGLLIKRNGVNYKYIDEPYTVRQLNGKSIEFLELIPNPDKVTISLFQTPYSTIEGFLDSTTCFCPDTLLSYTAGPGILISGDTIKNNLKEGNNINITTILDTLKIDQGTESVRWTADITVSGINTQLDNWNPTGWGTIGTGSSTIINFSLTGNQLLTGLANPGDGRFAVFNSLEGQDTLTVKNQSSGSSGPNRFAIVSDFDILPGTSAIFQYNTVKGSWLLIGTSVRALTPTGAETIINAGTGISVSGAGTVGSPYVITNTGDTNATDDVTIGSPNYLQMPLNDSTLVNSRWYQNGTNTGYNTVSPGSTVTISTPGQDVSIPTLGAPGGKLGLMNDNNTYGLLMGVNASGDTWFQGQRVDGVGTAYNILLQPSGGRLGVGPTISPARTLHVQGEVRITDLITDPSNAIVGKDADGDLGTIIPRDGLVLSGGLLTAKDSSVTNELQNLSWNPATGFIDISDGNSISLDGRYLTSETYTGTVTNFSAGDLSPLFTTSEATTTTTPALSFTAVNQAQHLVYAGPNFGSPAAPTFRLLNQADIPALAYVTSVGLSLPTSVFSISGTPVTGSGTLTGTFQTQSAGTVFAGPTTGGAAAPAFRSLIAGDIPPLPYLSSAYYQTLRDNNTGMTQRAAANFVSTATINMALTDDAPNGETEIRADIPTDGITSTEIAANAVNTVEINNNAVTYAKIQQVAAQRLLGNPTGTLANATEIPVGTGLGWSSGTTLINTGDTNAADDVTSTGTVNYLQKVTATGPVILGNSSVYDTGSGAVGINTASPMSQLHVYSSIAGPSSTEIRLDMNNSTAGVLHSTGLLAVSETGGTAYTKFRAASPTTGTTRGRLIFSNEAGTDFLTEIGPNAGNSSYALTLYNYSNIPKLYLNTDGKSYLAGAGIVVGGTSGSATNHFYDAVSTSTVLGDPLTGLRIEGGGGDKYVGLSVAGTYTNTAMGGLFWQQNSIYGSFWGLFGSNNYGTGITYKNGLTGDPDGRVGIGYDIGTPFSYKLNVSGNTLLSGTLRLTTPTGTPTALAGYNGSGDVGTVGFGTGFSIVGGNLTYTPATSGTVTNFSAGDLSPLFTTSEATTTTTPALSFTLNTQTAGTVFAGPTTGGAAAPAFRTLVAADIPALSYDPSTTNEGSLTVGVGGATTSLINSNTSGSTPVTLSATGIITLAESSNTIVIGATEVDGSLTNEGFMSVAAGASNTSIIQSNTSGSPDITFQYAGILTGSESGNTVTLTATELDGSTTNEIQTLSTGTNTISLTSGGGPFTVDTDPATDITSASGATAGYIAYFDGTRTVTGVSDWYRDVTNSRVGLGVSTSPLAKMHIAGTGATSSTHNFRTTNSSGTVGINSRDDGAVSIGSSVPQTGFALTTVGQAYFSSDVQVAGGLAKTAAGLWGRDATGFLVPITFNTSHITLSGNVLDVTGANPVVAAGNNNNVVSTTSSGITTYRVDQGLGAIAWKGDTTLSGISSTLSDWTPPGWGTTTVGIAAKTIIGVTMTGNQTLNSVTNGFDGRWFCVYNLDTNDKLTVVDQGTGTTGNKFFLEGDFDVLPGQFQKFIYSSIKGGWILDGHQNTDTEFFTTGVTTTTFDINDGSGKTTDVDGNTISTGYVAFVGNLAAYTLTKNNTPLARSGTVTRDYSFNPSTGVVTLTATPVTGDKFVLTMRP